MLEGNCNGDITANDDYNSLLMILGTAISKTKGIFTNYVNLKSSCEKHITELEWKTQECNKLKTKMYSLENIKCQKCSKLEAEVLHYKKESTEAQNRIKSIANILKLGDNMDESDGQKRNAAMTLVSQLLLEESPKLKKKHFPDNSPLQSLTTKQDSENKHIISPKVSFKNDLRHKSINLPVSSPKRSPRGIKRNLTADLKIKKLIGKSPKKKLILNKNFPDQLSLNTSLDGYVNDANAELDKIWFCDDAPKNNEFDTNDELLNATPPLISRKNIWKMKEVRGPSEVTGTKKLRQMRLDLSVETNKVDLCSLDGYDSTSSINDNLNVQSIGGVVDEKNLELESTYNPCLENFKPLATSTQTNYLIENKNYSEVNLEPAKSACHLNSENFNPSATNIEKNDYRVANKNASPNYNYKRETIRKRSDRVKLDGWNCTQCAEYYQAVDLSPSKAKARMNKCSRHRDKFDQANQTPPDYWNPIFPDSEECRKKKLYVSVRCKDEK